MLLRNALPLLVLGATLAAPAAAQPDYADDDIWLLETCCLEEGLEEPWTDPDADPAGAPPAPEWSDDGPLCREYESTVVIGGREQRAIGTACRMPDGSWQIMSSRTSSPPPPAAPRAAEPSVVVRERVVYQPVYAPLPVRFVAPGWYGWYPFRPLLPPALYRPVVVYPVDRHGRQHHHGRGRGHLVRY